MTWPDGSLRCCPPPGGTTTPLLVVMEDLLVANATRIRPLAGGNYHDLDLHLWVVHLRLDRGAGGRLAGHDPEVPHRIQGGEVGQRRSPLRTPSMLTLRQELESLGLALMVRAGPAKDLPTQSIDANDYLVWRYWSVGPDADSSLG